MTQLERIANAHRVAVRRDTCGDPIIPGKNGHLYTDAGAVTVCFTDDGRKRPFPTRNFKTVRLRTLQPYIVKLRQEGDYEFIAQIVDADEAIALALFRILQVRRFMVTKGISRPVPVKFLERHRKRRAEKGAEIDFAGLGDPGHPGVA